MTSHHQALQLAHGAVGPADEIAGLAALPIILLVLFVAHLRRRSRRTAEPADTRQPASPPALTTQQPTRASGDTLLPPTKPRLQR